MGKISLDVFLNYKKIRDIRNKITNDQMNEVYKIIKYYKTDNIGNRLVNIRDFILYGVEDNWLDRLKIITTTIKNDVVSEYSCKIRYGDKWDEKRKSHISKTRMDKKKFIELYGEDEGIKKWKERNEKVKSYGIKYMIERYGEKEGKIKWEKTLNQKIETMKKRKKIKPYRNGLTLVEYQKKYGIDDGYKRWIIKNEKQSYRRSIEYYLETYGKENGLILWNEYCESMSKTSLNSFIERYGEIEGNKRYNCMGDKLRYKSSQEYYIKEYGNDNGIIKYQELINKKINYFSTKYSKISQDLFWNIYERLENKENCYFAELNDEYVFYAYKNDLTIINVDFKYNEKIIEFDGEYWHSSNKQKIIDKNRDDFLKLKGYKILRINEILYHKNKEQTINECINFLKN
jgi:hypothetical protein